MASTKYPRRLDAALAWIDYAAGTVNAIAATAADRRRTKALAGDGEIVLTALKELGGDKAPVSGSKLRRKARMDKKRFDAVVAALMQMGPSPIAIHEEEFVSGNATKRTRAMFILTAQTTPGRQDADPC